MSTSRTPPYHNAQASLRRGSKKLFWSWILYQTIKGTLTTSLIWIPLALAWWRG